MQKHSHIPLSKCKKKNPNPLLREKWQRVLYVKTEDLLNTK